MIFYDLRNTLFLFCGCMLLLNNVGVKAQDGADDQEICLPIRQTLGIRPPHPPSQGRPGKLGPRGLPGSTGSRGEPGADGRCACNPNEVERLNNTIQTLTGKLRSLRLEMITALHRGYMELDDGWITPFNGFQYKITASGQPWQNSRRTCQRMGGDLATYGAQDWNTRRIIRNAFNGAGVIWIGLSDTDQEGEWKWINGHGGRTPLVTRETGLWWGSQPQGGTRENCGGSAREFYTHDYACSVTFKAMCEKAM